MFFFILLTDSRTFGKPPDHIIAQPSRVKVTHVYNQSVWSNIPSTAVQDHVTPSPSPGHTNQVTAQLLKNQALPHTALTGGTNLSALQKVSFG